MGHEDKEMKMLELFKLAERHSGYLACLMKQQQQY